MQVLYTDLQPLDLIILLLQQGDQIFAGLLVKLIIVHLTYLTRLFLTLPIAACRYF